MSVRNLVTVAVIFLAVSYALWLATENQAAASLSLPMLPDIENQPQWVLTFLSFLAGALAALLYTVVLSSRDAFSRWRSRRRERSVAESGRLLSEGLEAAVQGNHRRALRRFEAILESDRDHVAAWRLGGDAARRAGDLDRAVDMHVRARGLAPEDPDVHAALAADFEAVGQYARAVGHLQQSLSFRGRPDADAQAWLRELLAREGRWDEAIEAQERRLKMVKDTEVRRDEESILRGLRLEKALQLLERGGRDRVAEAETILQGLVKEEPQFTPAHLLLGEARLLADDPEGATVAWLDGLEATHSLPLLDHLVDHYLESGQPEMALKVYQRAIEELDAERARAARLGLAFLYARLEMLEEAQAAFEELEEASDSLTLRYQLGRLKQRRGDDREAAAVYREVIEAAGVADPHYRCDQCGATFDEYQVRCDECRRWGTVVDDRAREVELADEPGVRVPRI